MFFLLGFICFLISIFGFSFEIRKRFDIKIEFIFSIVFSLIGLLMFIAGLLNIMKLTALILCFSGIYFSVQNIIKHEKIVKETFSNNNTYIYLIVIIFISIVGYNMHLVHYDNFSHWGLVIKNIFLKDGLPNFEDTVIMFKGYQPGSACFTYYFGLLCGKTEGIMIIAHNLMIFTFFYSLYAFVKKNEILKKIILFLIYIFIMIINIAFNDLLVDTLIATMTIASLSLLYYYKNNLKLAVIYVIPILIFLLLVKNTGLILVGFSCLYILYLSFEQKQLKKGFYYIVIIGILCLFFLLIWQGHVTMVYGESALNSKHSLTVSNIISSLKSKGIDNIIDFCKMYIKHFFELRNNIANIYMLAINTIVILFALITKKKFFKILIAINSLYILYFGILGVMYLLSMPWSEAIRLASFDRYMLTVVTIIIGIVLIYLFESNKSQIYLLPILLIVIGLIIYNGDTAKIILGKTEYDNSIVEKFDEILETKKIFSDKYTYVYSAKSKNDFGYLNYLSKYKLNSTEVKAIRNVDEFNNESIDNSRLIVIYMDKEIKDYIDKNNFIEESKGIYLHKKMKN